MFHTVWYEFSLLLIEVLTLSLVSIVLFRTILLIKACLVLLMLVCIFVVFFYERYWLLSFVVRFS